MPTIIDSLFLELGIDTSKFSADQARALSKIQQFESQAKRSSGKAADGVKTVGKAFHDLASDSSIGGASQRIESLATKLKALGQSAQIAGGAGGALGGMAKGLGMLLSPASLGIAALGLLGKAAFDFNAEMTATNATLQRNSELAGLSSSKLWAMGEAALTTGGDPASVEANMAGMGVQFAGAAIGVGDASAQMRMMAMLSPYGAHFKAGGFARGPDEESLFRAIANYKRQHGRAAAEALALSGGLSVDTFNLMASSTGYGEYQKALVKAKKLKAPGGFEGVVSESLKNQAGLGEKDIQKAVLSEQSYGGIQHPMQTLVGLTTGIYAILTSTLGYIAELVGWLTGSKPVEAYQAAAHAVNRFANKIFPGIAPSQSPESVKQKQALAMTMLVKGGESRMNAAAIVGNWVQESQLDPFATRDHGAHIGLGQWDRIRQADFARQSGYRMGDPSVSANKQRFDQIAFQLAELRGKYRKAQVEMDKAGTLRDKTQAFEDYDEKPGLLDFSFPKRFGFAQEALQGIMSMVAASSAGSSSAVTTNVRSDTRIGDIHLHTPPLASPGAYGAAIRNNLAGQPLLNSSAQHMVAIASRGAGG